MSVEWGALADEWSEWMAAASVQLAVLIAVVGVAAWLVRRLSARYRYVLWSLVLIKVFLWPGLSAPWSVGRWVEMSPRIAEEERVAGANAAGDGGETHALAGRGESGEGSVAIESVARGDKVEKGAVRSGAGMPAAGRAGASWSMAQRVMAGWACGVGVFVALVAIGWGRVAAIVRRGRPVEEGPIAVAVERLALGLGAESPPPVVLSDAIESPFVTGLVRTRIVLPAGLAERVGAETLDDVLLHELVHWKRRDLWVAWAQTVAQGLFWFHPLVWWANARIRLERECACDEGVLAANGRRAERYAESLMQVLLAVRGKAAVAPAFVGIFEPQGPIQRRVEGIMEQDGKMKRAGWVHWVALGLFAAACLPMAAQEETGGEVVTATGGDAEVGTEPGREQHRGQEMLTHDQRMQGEALQARVAGAQPGDVVEVAEGTFPGMLIIDKPLTLRGQGADKTALELLWDTPTISITGTQDVIIEDMTVRWSNRRTQGDLESPAAIAVLDGTATIRNCVIEPMDRPMQTPYGVLAKGRSDVTVEGCRATGFAYTLMFTDGANGTVRDCVLTGADHSEVTMHAGSAVTMERNVLGGCNYHAVRNTGGTMTMRDNLVYGDYRAGAYLGNSSAHGTIENNLFMGHGGGIWSYAQSDVTVARNLFWRNREVGVSVHGGCLLELRGNMFVENPKGVVRYLNRSVGIGARLSGNLFWGNGEDTVDLDLGENVVAVDPAFENPVAGDFRARGEGIGEVGLSDPGVIRELWGKLPAEDREKLEAVAGADFPITSGSDEEGAVDARRPRVASVTPSPGQTDVDPGLSEIVAVFDRDMNTGGYSWVQYGPSFPPRPAGASAYWKDARTCALPVALEPGKTYLVGINDAKYNSFRSADGKIAVPLMLEFHTAGGEPAEAGKPTVVKLEPANGATGVDPGIEEIRVTFDRPMATGGMSWCGGGESFPPIREGLSIYWTEDGLTCVMPVALAPNHRYEMMINCPSYRNFQSAEGVTVDPVPYSFQTGGGG